MDGHSRVFLDICTLDAIARLFADARPAWVWSSDGHAILWANAAGAAFFRAASMDALLARTLADNAPARPHLARIARDGSPDRDSIERLRFYLGPKMVLVTALARQITLPDGNAAALVVAVDAKTTHTTPPLLALCQLLTSDTVAAFLIGSSDTADGAIIARAGTLSPPRPAGIVPDADGEDSGAMSASADIDGARHPARIAHLGEGAGADFLLLVSTEPLPVAADTTIEADTTKICTDTFSPEAEAAPLTEADEPSSTSDAEAGLTTRETRATDAAVAPAEADERARMAPDTPRAVATSRFPKNFFPWRRLVQANEPRVSPVVAEGSANENGNGDGAAQQTDPAIEERMIAEALAAKKALLAEDALADSPTVRALPRANGALTNGAAGTYDDFEEADTQAETIAPAEEGARAEEGSHAATATLSGTDTTADMDRPDDSIAKANEAAEVTETNESILSTQDAPDVKAVASDEFVFAGYAPPVRFVWQMDAERRFTSISKELAQVLGPASTDIVGHTWAEIAERLDVDRDGKIAQSLERRDTWSGLTVDWPVTDNPIAVPVDLAALPAFDRNRVFEGYRGFGVCRPSDAITMATIAPHETAPLTALPDDSRVEAADELHDTVADDAYEPDDTHDAGGLTDGDETTADVSSTPETQEPVGVSEPAEAARMATGVADQPAIIAPFIKPPTYAGMYTGTENTTVAADNDTMEPAAFGLPAAANADVWQAPVDDALTQDALEPRITGESLDTIEGLDIDAHVIAEETLAATPAGEPEAAQTPTDARTRAETAPEDESAGSETGALAGLSMKLRDVTPLLPFSEPARVNDKVMSEPANASDGDADNDESFAETVIRLAERQPIAPETVLTKPEREAFRKIAEALGNRIEDTNRPAARDTSGKTPAASDASPSEDAAWQAQATRKPSEAAPEIETDAGTATGAGTGASTQTAPDKPLNAPIPMPIAARSTASKNGFGEAARETAASAEDVSIHPRLLDRLPIGVAIVRERDVVYANNTLMNMLGYENLALLAKAGGLEAIFAEPEEWPAVAGPDEEVERTLRVQLSDGSLRPVDAHMHTVPWQGGRALMISLRDKRDPTRETAIDRLHEAKTALTRAEDRVAEMDAILETATDGVLVLAADGRILQANRSALALFGVDDADMAGASLTDYLAPESHRGTLDYLDGLAVNGVASVLNDGREVIAQISGGGLTPLFMTVGRIGGEDDQVKLCAVLRDITQWKKAEEELTRAKRQAENASSKKSDFLAKISHEIRTPLNAIIGFSEVMIQERFGAIGNERYKDYLSDIHNSGSHLLSLVNDLLDLSKVEAGKLDLSFEAVPVNEVIGECVALMQPQANRERIIIRTSLPASVPNIVADQRSLRQIVLNLLSNAIKFNQPGGQVIVSTALEPNGVVVLRVRDTGIGMSGKDIKAALEPFRQLHTARLGGGTGLGLPLTKALVEANRAHFSIDSTPNHGTLVEITFPSQRVLAE